MTFNNKGIKLIYKTILYQLTHKKNIVVNIDGYKSHLLCYYILCLWLTPDNFGL